MDRLVQYGLICSWKELWLYMRLGLSSSSFHNRLRIAALALSSTLSTPGPWQGWGKVSPARDWPGTPRAHIQNSRNSQESALTVPTQHNSRDSQESALIVPTQHNSRDSQESALIVPTQHNSRDSQESALIVPTQQNSRDSQESAADSKTTTN